MTAQQELQEWLKQHRQLDNEVEKEHFYQNLLATLGQKDSEYFQEGLLALKESVRAVRMKAGQVVDSAPAGSFQVFPKSLKEQELLQKLLENMGIPFKMGA